MPRFHRRTRFRRRRRRRRRMPRRRFRRRRSVPDPEQKDLTITQNVATDFNGVIFLLNGVMQGVNVSERQGRRALFLSVFVRYCLILDATNTGLQCYRIALVQDKFPQTAFPAIADIWTSVGSPAAPMGMRTLSISNRFRVLTSRLLQMDVANQAKRGSMFKRLRLSSVYLNPGAGIGDIEINALYLILISDQDGTAMQAPPIYTGLTRVRFTG